VINAYGPTETTVWCFTEVVPPGKLVDTSEATVPLGVPLPDVEYRIVRGDGALPNEGELVIWGPGVPPEGYWNPLGPKPTTASESAATGRAGDGYTRRDDAKTEFWTGDIVAEWGDSIYFKHRRDLQVKVRGHRVELEEVENAAVECGLTSPVAVANEVGVWLVVEGELAESDKIREEMAHLLPREAVPRAIISVESLPRGANDKIDRRAVASSVLPDSALLRGAE
jgi:acyl-CoA synthetase (AMP-forming)/AMP-acid ligase II